MREKYLEIALMSKKSKLAYDDMTIIILSIFYLIGIVGIALPIHPQFVLLTPLNLLLSLILVLLFHKKWDTKSKAFMLLAFIIGFGAEVIGVNTGLIFGSYKYGPVLGPKLAQTPLMIGVNWLLLAYSTGILINNTFPRAGLFLKSLFGALVMVILDILIEPVAIALNFWSWGANGHPPIQNYIGWGGVAFLIFLLFNSLIKEKKNKVAIALLALQFIFFALLNILL